MFERFTQRARHTVVLSQEEARLLNHNYIGTEHILLGLLGEPDSVAGTVLTRFGFTREGVREEVTQTIGRGKKAPSGHIPFTPRAKKTLELSLREALAIKHNYIGTEHILLGLIREGDGVAVQILRDRVDLLELRAAILDAVSAMDPGEPSDAGEGDETNAVLRWLRSRLSRHAISVPFRPELLSGEPARRGTPAVEAALQQAARLAGPLPVGSHHLLLAALNDPNSAASATLASLGVDQGELRERLRSATVTGTSDEQPEQAGRRQMAIEVSGETLRLVLTDPVIVKAGQDALHAVQARTQAGDPESGQESVAANVIRGDHPLAIGLAQVWLDLRQTLGRLASDSAVAGAERTAPAGPAAAAGIEAETGFIDEPGPGGDEPGPGGEAGPPAARGEESA